MSHKFNRIAHWSELKNQKPLRGLKLMYAEKSEKIQNTNTGLDLTDSKYFREVFIKQSTVEAAYFVISGAENRTK